MIADGKHNEIIGKMKVSALLESMPGVGKVRARQIMERIKSGQAQYHFIEVMACPGGCVGGGGQPYMVNDEIRKQRAKGLYDEDAGLKVRCSHENVHVQQLYKDFLENPLSEKSHHLLHTQYTERERF